MAFRGRPVDYLWTVTSSEVFLGASSQSSRDRLIWGWPWPLEMIVGPFTVEMSR
jgi:hypothetical protein